MSASAEAVIVIPARYASSRFPGKPLASLRGVGGEVKSLIRRSWEAACRAGGVDRVIVATDDDRIAAEVESFGGEVVATPADCRNGTERCNAAILAAGIAPELVVNLQGDAPLTPPEAISTVLTALRADPGLAVATPILRCSPEMLDRLLDEQRSGRAGGTTAVFNRKRDALYFSKHVLPHGAQGLVPVYLHLGLYGYRRTALADYAALPASPLELAEGLEQLRFLDAGTTVRTVEIETPHGGIWEVNNSSDIGVVEAALAARGIA